MTLRTRRKKGRLRGHFEVPAGETTGVAAAPAASVREIVRRFWPYARPHRRRLWLALILVVLLPAIEAAQIWLFKLVIDDVLVPRDMRPLAWIASAYVLLTLGAGLVSFAGGYLSTWVGESFLLDLRRTLFQHVQSLSLDFFERRRLGDVLTRLTGDVAAIETFVVSGVARSIGYAIELTFFGALLFYLRWELALVALVVAPLAWVTMRFLTRLSKRASREKRRRLGMLTAVAEESLANAQLVQAYNREETEVERFHRESFGSFTAELASTRVKSLFAPLIDLVKVGGALAVIGAGTWELQQGRLSLGGVLVFLTYLSRLYSPIRGFSSLGNTVFAASAGAERIIELLDERPSVVEPVRARRLSRAEGRIDFDEVSFRYPDTEHDALSGVSFAIEPGETVALVGRNGAGKSTVAKLLLRFYDPARGAVRLDGCDVRELSLASLRSAIALLLQETLVFDGTIRENIAYGRHGAVEEQIVQAAQAADAHDYISELPDGYDTLVGQRGRRLSGGQRQRLAIARAMIRDAPVLILDEPTTSLDSSSTHRVLEPLRRLIEGRTTIVITHNLVTIREATRILVLDRGRIVEMGTHDELDRRDGTYAELYRLHRNGGGPERELTLVGSR